MVSLCANNQLLARVIFTPQVTLELRNHGVDTSMHAQIATRLLSLSVKMLCIWLQFSQKAKSANFKPPHIAPNRKNTKF